MIVNGLDASALDQKYVYLDTCPEPHLKQVVTLPLGSLRDRVSGVVSWREALLVGKLPAPGAWPPGEVAAPVLRALDNMGLVRFCRGQAELVDAVLADVLESLRRQSDSISEDVTRRLRELEALERQRLEAEAEERKKRDKKAPPPRRLTPDDLKRLAEQAEREVAAMDRGADPGLLHAWQERARAWASIAEVFGDLGSMLGRGWDLSIGVLRHAGWTDLVRLQKLLERLPQLRDVVRALGRLQHSDDGESVAEKVLEPVRRLEEERREVRTPHVPAEVRGITRGADLERMLPVEASMFGHPKLRFLWHARRAERALLTYRVEGTEYETLLTEREDQVEVERQRPRPQRGPIIAVIDTSGSMQGTPELVSKALALEALRTAHSERRRCFLYAFSGPGQVVEHELDLAAEGVGRLLAFLGTSFGGGTDPGVPLQRVLSRLGQEGWTRADVLFVSDGEFPVPPVLSRQVAIARESGTRFHGLQIGSLGRTGLHDLCDPVHVFTDWTSAGGGHSR